MFYNGITDTYMLTIEGRCDILDDRAGQLEVTCKTSDRDYMKHFLGLSDNVTYFAERNAGLSSGIAEPGERLARIESLLQHIVPRPADPPDAGL